MKLKPLQDRILVKPEKIENKTAGGIILAGDTQERVKTAIVLEVGENVNKDIIKKCKIMYDIHCGIKIKIDNEDCLILRDNEILAVVE